MNECSEIVALLSDYLDRDLPPGACSAVAAHLDSCTQCSKAAESLRATVDMCRQFRAQSLPGPISPERRRQLREAFQKVISGVGTEET